MPIAGRTADILRRDRVVLSGLLLWSAATVGTGLSRSVTEFLVWRGVFRVEFRDRVETLTPGQFLVVPKGVEHRTGGAVVGHVLHQGKIADGAFIEMRRKYLSAVR